MNVILLEKISNLGNLGDEVAVKPGYWRNYLLPQGKAVAANDDNRAYFESKRAELEKKAEEKLNAAKEKVDYLVNKSVKIAVKASDEGKLYGSVGPAELAHAISEITPVDKKEILLAEGPFRSIGEYEIKINLLNEIVIPFKVNIVAE